MIANAVSLLGIFDTKLRLEVPLFQRQYVWDREHQWEPLWEDISRKFIEYLEARKDGPVHFLGAMVLDQKQTPITHVERRQVIDGQQRLTTLQIFLAAFRDFCRMHGHEELAKECARFLANSGMMADPKVDRFKMWPTNLDRPQFVDVVESGSRAELEKRHPLIRPKYARRPLPRPRMVEAYLYFSDELDRFFIGTQTDLPLAADVLIIDRLTECFSALQNSLRVVVINLEPGDDAQVIFETLNARGQPLLPSDLLRNFIFLRASRNSEPQEELYEEHWRPFDDQFWRIEEQQGRIKRPRSDLFMQHYLSFRLKNEVPIGHLFVEYKHWIDSKRPFAKVEDELKDLSRHRENFKLLLAPNESTALGHLARFLQIFEVKTIYPLLLGILHSEPDETELSGICQDLESYLLRRAVCGLTTKNYNRIFLSFLNRFTKSRMDRAQLRVVLAEQSGESSLWPDDALFRKAWMAESVYTRLQPTKTSYILRRINEYHFGPKSENIKVDGPLSVEHVLPQQWIPHWPLPDGSKGLSWMERIDKPPDDVCVQLTVHRESLVHTFGNLTIVTQPLNSALSNGPYLGKRAELLRQSFLPLNHQFQDYPDWNEAAIKERGEKLFELASSIWPGPSQIQR